MSITSNSSFTQTTQNALLEAANLFRQNKVDDAYHVLHEKISLPQTEGKLTKAQADAVYRSMIPDPLASPETPFSKRSCIPAIALRGHALKDLVAHYNLPEGNVKSAILNAAAILETQGNEEEAWKVLNKALIPSRDNESLIKEVHRIMIDSLRTPTSSFLQKHVKDHPAILEDNFLRANTLECLSSHFFDKEVVEGSKIQLDSPILEFRAKTRSAIQQAAQLFREGKPEKAQELLKSAILIPYEKGELTKGQVDAVYKTLEDPFNPQTEFAKRQFQSLLTLRAQALRDLVAYYSKLPNESSSGHQLDDKAKNAILKAARLLETQGNLEEARKLLNDALPSALSEKSPGITDEMVKEIHCIMNESLSAPTSAFLRKRIQENPSLVDENRLRAKALESLASHIFDDAVVKGEAPQFKVFAGTERVILEKNLAQLAIPLLGTQEKTAFGLSSKSSKETVAKSIRYREEVSWKELREWRLMGIKLDKEMLSGVRIINNDGVKEVDDAELNDILSLCGEHVEVLDFGPNQFKRSFLAIVGKHCPNLLSFTAANSDERIDANALEGFTSGCRKLQHLTLKNCRLSSTESPSSPGTIISALAPVARNCHDLRSIDISGNGICIEDSDIVTLASGCKMITDFNAEGAHLGDTALRALAQCPLLRSLKLAESYIEDRGYRARRGEKNFTIDGMKVFVSGCRALEELSLISCHVKDDVLAVVGEARLPLTKVTITQNSPAGVRSLIKGIPQVRELNIASNRLEDNAMEDIAEHCPLVTKLVISGNENISPEGVNTAVSKCNFLTHLEMVKVGNGIQSNYLQEAMTDSPGRLTSINFSHRFDAPTTGQIIDFIKKHKELRHIQLPPLFVTDEVLLAIAENCPNLESLHIKEDQYSGASATAQGLAALGRGCPHLKRLTARFNKAEPSGDEFLKAIGENFSELTYLDISFCKQQEGCMSGRGFTALGKGCNKLSELRISDYYISRNTCDVISVACPSLKRIDCTGSVFHNGREFESLVKKSPAVSIRYSKERWVNPEI